MCVWANYVATCFFDYISYAITPSPPSLLSPSLSPWHPEGSTAVPTETGTAPVCSGVAASACRGSYNPLTRPHCWERSGLSGADIAESASHSVACALDREPGRLWCVPCEGGSWRRGRRVGRWREGRKGRRQVRERRKERR